MAANRYRCAAYSKDSKSFYAGGADGVIRPGTPRGAASGTLKGHNGEVRALAFNPAGNRLASGSTDFTARLWDFDIVLQSRDLSAMKAGLDLGL